MPPSPLAAPLDLPCGVRLANRIGKSAMTEALAGPDDAPNVAHDTLYARWSKGGLAVQLTGNVMIDRRYLERPGNVVIDREPDDAMQAALAAWASAGSMRSRTVRASVTSSASSWVSTTTGLMVTISSVRPTFSLVLENSLPSQGISINSGIPDFPVVRVSLIRPPRTTV